MEFLALGAKGGKSNAIRVGYTDATAQGTLRLFADYGEITTFFGSGTAERGFLRLNGTGWNGSIASGEGAFNNVAGDNSIAKAESLNGVVQFAEDTPGVDGVPVRIRVSAGSLTIHESITDGAFIGTAPDFEKTGPGTLTFDTSNHNYSGNSNVLEGKLVVNSMYSGIGAFTVNSAATLAGNGSISTAVTVNAGGVLAPGTSIGTLTVGSADIDGKLQIEYDGAASTIDRLAVTGTLDIANATLDFDKIGAAALTGGPHVFATYGSLVGTSFSSVLELPAGYSINYNYLGANQIALIGGSHPGDFDSDGDVDGADFVAWQTNFPTATGATLAQGDADGDGDVDGADFVVWQTNFPFTPAPGTSPVPEPQAIVLVFLGAAAMLMNGRNYLADAKGGVHPENTA
jgi:autotransporter-associated beta strand protein